MERRIEKEASMTHPGESDPFGGFEDDFKNTETAGPVSVPGRVPPATYRVAVGMINIGKEEDVLVDHVVIDSTAKGGSKGFKLSFEILEPEAMPDGEVVKGRTVEKVFWITQKNLPYVKRDIATILGRDLESLSELTKIPWAGKTCEIVVRDEEYQGMINSRVAFVNKWDPKTSEAAKKIVEKRTEKKEPGNKTAKAPEKKADVAF
jgi:hypothetical protein